MWKKMALCAAVSVAALVLIKRAKQAREERELWREATDTSHSTLQEAT